MSVVIYIYIYMTMSKICQIERQLRKIPDITVCQKFMTPILEFSADLGLSAWRHKFLTEAVVLFGKFYSLT